MSKENDDSSIRRGSNNVFADLGYRDPETHLLKVQLVNRINEIVTEKQLTQVQAAQAMGISQPDVSRILKGQFRDVSVERIMRMLTRLGCEIDIVIKAPVPQAHKLSDPSSSCSLVFYVLEQRTRPHEHSYNTGTNTSIGASSCHLWLRRNN